MPNVITVGRKRKKTISRSANGDGIIRLNPEATDVLEEYLAKTNGQLNVKELASGFILYAANDTIIRIKDEED